MEERDVDNAEEERRNSEMVHIFLVHWNMHVQ